MLERRFRESRLERLPSILSASRRLRSLPLCLEYLLQMFLVLGEFLLCSATDEQRGRATCRFHGP